MTIEITLITGLLLQNLEKIEQINNIIIYAIVIFIITMTLLNLLSILNFYKAKQINEQVIPIPLNDIKRFFNEKNKIEKDIYLMIADTQKAIHENYIIKENKIRYIEKGSSRLIITIILLTIFLILLTIIIL